MTEVDVSVILATRDRDDLLETTLRRLAAQESGGIAWEVIVADNGSTDRTPAVLEEARSYLPLANVTEPAPGKNRALNRALPLARGDLLLFTDDDVLPDPRWIAEMAAAAARWPAHSVFAGRIVPRFPAGAPAWIREHWFPQGAYARFELPQHEGPTDKVPFGGNFMVRSRAMAGVRFSEEIGPDASPDYVSGSETELLQRLTRRGERIVYVPSAVVEHIVRPEQLSVKWLHERSYRHGRCLVELGFVQRNDGPRIAGVPVGVWARLAKEWIYRLSGAFGDDRRRFIRGLDYHFLRGCVRQHRLIARRTRRPPPAGG